LTHRDLGDARLWAASHHRSLDRRKRAAAPPRRLPGATASLALAVGATTVAVPALSAGIETASAASGLKSVQRALGVTADGVMGPRTRAAIKRFQRRHDLPATGRLDRRTRAALREGRSSSRSRSRRGDAERFRGAWVAALQRKLGLEADGVFGPKTRAAVKAYQAEHDLQPATGAPGPRTLASMGISRSSSATVRTIAAPGEADAEAEAPAGEGVAAAVEAARSQIGKPYRSAGDGPDGFDCSGLTVFAFKRAGISLGRSSFAQYEQGESISRSEIQAGDLVFFDSNGSGASHVGVATGPTRMISATTRGVMESGFSSGYWDSHYVGARRVS
jgi:cell wall-associated NlpC family hydrolase